MGILKKNHHQGFSWLAGNSWAVIPCWQDGSGACTQQMALQKMTREKYTNLLRKVSFASSSLLLDHKYPCLQVLLQNENAQIQHHPHQVGVFLPPKLKKCSSTTGITFPNKSAQTVENRHETAHIWGPTTPLHITASKVMFSPFFPGKYGGNRPAVFWIHFHVST